MKTGEATPKIYLDIETFSGEKPPLDSFTADGRLKDPAKISDDLLKKQDAGWRKQSLDPYKGEVFCIGVALNDDPASCLWAGDEGTTMKLFEEYIKRFPGANIYGHNLIDFDAYWLFVKGLQYGLKNVVTTFSNKYNLKDTMLAMDGAAWKKMTSLDKMAKTLGFEGKGDITGAMVHDMVLEGKGDRVCQYCISDVEILRNCANKLSEYGLI
jgi:hypothetical protein